MSHVSYSQLTAWTRCGKAFQLVRLQQAPEQPTVWLPAGKAVHAAFESINKAYFNSQKGNTK